MSHATKPFGRTNEPVATVWHEQPDGEIIAGDWRGLVIGHDDLERRGGDRIRQRVATLGRPFEFLVVRDLLANDLKVGWPLHQLQRLRDEKLYRYIVVDAHDVLEAEWIAANAPVHGVIVAYEPADLSARYRVFTAAANGGVALIGRALIPEAAAVHLATPQITATLLSPGVCKPSPLSAEEVECLWTDFSARNAEPPKLRGGHPPDYGA